MLNTRTLQQLTDLKEVALKEMGQVENPVWRRHFEDLAVACSSLLAAHLQMQEEGTASQKAYTAGMSS